MQRPRPAALRHSADQFSGYGFSSVEVVIRWPFIRMGKRAGTWKDIGLAGLNQEYSTWVSQRNGGGMGRLETPRYLAYKITRNRFDHDPEVLGDGNPVEALHGCVVKIQFEDDVREVDT